MLSQQQAVARGGAGVVAFGLLVLCNLHTVGA